MLLIQMDMIQRRRENNFDNAMSVALMSPYMGQSLVDTLQTSPF